MGSRVQVAFGIGRWAISRLAEVRRCHADIVGLALNDPLPQGLWSQLLDMSSPQLMRPLAADLPDIDPPPVDANEPTEILRRAWVSDGGETVGRVAVGRWMTTTWLVHLTCARAMHPQALTCWRDLYRFAATAPLYSDGPRAHLAALYDVDGPWHHRFTEGFVDWLEDSTCATSLRVERRRVPARKNTPSGLGLLPADHPSVERLARRLAVRFAPLIRTALGWNVDRLHARTTPIRPEDPPSLPAAGVFTVTTDRELGHVIVDPMPVVGSAAKPSAATWIVPAEDADRKALVEAARLAAGQCGFVHTDVFAGPRQTASVAPAEPTGVMVWSAEGLRQYDQYLFSLFGDDASSFDRPSPL